MVVVSHARGINPLASQGEVLVRVDGDEDGPDRGVHVAGHVATAQDLQQEMGWGDEVSFSFMVMVFGWGVHSFHSQP